MTGTRDMTQQRGALRPRRRAPTGAAAGLSSDVITAQHIGRWCIAALTPLLIGYLMYVVEASDNEKSRLTNPVAAMGEVVAAECKTYRKAGAYSSPVYMRVMVSFLAPASSWQDGAVQPGQAVQSHQSFTATREVSYRSWVECEADLPVVQAAKAPHPVWYERGNPHAARTSLDERDSRGLLWVGLAGVPLALYAALLVVLRQRQRRAISNAPPGLPPGAGELGSGVPMARDPWGWAWAWAWALVKFVRSSLARKLLIGLFFLFWIVGFAGQLFWYQHNERAGEERVRAASGPSGR
jgi:hypothetical protein